MQGAVAQGRLRTSLQFIFGRPFVGRAFVGSGRHLLFDSRHPLEGLRGEAG